MKNQDIKQLYELFREEILRVFLDPSKGIDYLIAKCKVKKEDVYSVIDPNSFRSTIKGDVGDKDRIVAFKKLFKKNTDEGSAFYDLLSAVLPPSIQAYKKELDLLRNEKGKSWQELEELVGLDFRRLYNYYLGIFYPSIENLKKMSAVLSIELIQQIALEIHGQEIEVNAIATPDQTETDLLVRIRQLDSTAQYQLVCRLLPGLAHSDLLHIASLAIKEAMYGSSEKEIQI